MDSSTNWPPALAERLGPVRALESLGGRASRARVDGIDVLVKRGPAVRDEARGLDRLGRVEGGPRVPEVLYCDQSLLVTEWIPSGLRSPTAEERLGRGLAAVHSTDTGEWGGGAGWIGECPVDPSPAPTAADFYGRRLTDLAGRCGLAGVVAPVVERLAVLIPPAPPALLHGDLWWGNVLWADDGRPALIDPSVHGGHPEEDLAMLAVFGPVPDRVRRAYSEVRPLDDGWADRVALWQLYPLLVHTVLFGGAYRSSAEAVARRYS